VERESLQPRFGTVSTFCAGAAEESGCPVRRSRRWERNAAQVPGGQDASLCTATVMLSCFWIMIFLEGESAEAGEKPAVTRRSRRGWGAAQGYRSVAAATPSSALELSVAASLLPAPSKSIGEAFIYHTDWLQHRLHYAWGSQVWRKEGAAVATTP